jgi:tetratricopeptide (TPR) repeat protein
MKRLIPVLLMTVTLAAGCAGVPPQGVERGAGPAKPVAAAAKAVGPLDQAQLYLDVVEGLIRQERYGAAVAFLDAVKGHDFGPRYTLLRGNALLGLERPEEALAAYAALDNTALAAEGWNGKGRVAAARKQWRAASKNFREAVRNEPSNPDFLNNLAFAGMHLDESGESAAYLRQAWELKPDSSLIRNNLLIALTLSGDHDGADTILKSVKDAGERDRVMAVIDSAIRDNTFAREETP